MPSLFVYWKLPPADTQHAVARLRALHAAWLEAEPTHGLQARLYQRPQADAQGRLTLMAAYHTATGLGASWVQRVVAQLQAAIPGGHVEIFDELST